MHSTDKPAIASALLGLTAYQRAQGARPLRAAPVKPVASAATYAPNRAKPAATPARPAKATKEIKMSVLKSLHAQSNAGMVTIRDVSSALDDLLKYR